MNILAGEASNASISTIREVNQLIRKAKSRKEVLVFSKLDNISDLRVKLYTDASYDNPNDQTRSTEGRVVLAENPSSMNCCILTWKTKRIPRVCRSVKNTETQSLDDEFHDAIDTVRILKEIYTGTMNLKQPEQIPVTALTDSKFSGRT